MLESIKQELIDEGLDPDDFKITQENGVIKVVPKWYYETKQIAVKEDKPIKENVDITAETIAMTSQDMIMIADTLAELMMRVQSLEEELKND